MLKLKVKIRDDWNNEKEEFETEYFDLVLEHSLVSLSKWESKHEKAYLGKEEKTEEEIASYFKCMIVNDTFPEDIIQKLDQDSIFEIGKYVNAKMTATTVYELNPNAPASSETITSELIYYWIVSYQIDWAVEHWHLNRLLMLIRLFSAKHAKDSKGKKMDARQIANRNRMINEQRRAANGSKG